MASSTTVHQYIKGGLDAVTAALGYQAAPYILKFPRGSHDGFAVFADLTEIGGPIVYDSQIRVILDDTVTEDKLAYWKDGAFTEIAYVKDV